MAQNPEIAQINDANKITFNLELAQESGIYWNRDHKYHSHLQVIFHGLNIQSLIDRLDSIPSDELKQIISSANQFRRLLGSLNIRWRT